MAKPRKPMDNPIVDPAPLPDERRLDASLRPRNFSEYVGQRAVVDKLRVYVAAARKRDEALDHCLFSGPPGLGKTFLSAAIARVVAENGYSVAYDTVSALLASFEREKFSRSEEEQSAAASRVRQLMGCDLLILDDLGTEMLTAFTQSALYSLLDGRIRAGKSTIISTNLDRAAISERYGPQLSSRLAGEYQWLTFLGRDIRQVRKERG